MLDAPSVVADAGSSGPPLPLQSSARAGPSPLLAGMARPDMLALALDFAVSGSTLSPQSFARLALPPPVLSSGFLGSLLPSRTCSRPELFSLLPGCFHVGSPSPASAWCRAGAFLFLQSLAQLGLLPAALGISHPGSALAALEFASLDVTSLIRSFLHIAPFLLVLGIASLGSLLIAADFSTTGPFSLPRSHSQSELALAPFGASKLGLPPIAPDVSTPGSSTPLRHFLCPGSLLTPLGPGRSGSAAIVPDLLRLDLVLLLRGFAQVAFSLLALGLARPDSLMAALGSAQVAASLLLQQFACADLPLFAPSIARTDAPTLIADSGHPGMFLFLHCLSRAGSFLFALGIGRLGFFLAVADSSQTDVPPSIRNLGRSGVALLALQACRPGSALSIMDLASFDVFSLVRSFACFGFGPPTTGDATTGGNVNLVSSLTIRHVGRPDFLLFALGLASFGSFSLAPELMQLGFSLVMRSLARLGFMILALHSGGSGSSLPSRNFARPDAALLLCGKARLDSILVANGNLYPGFALYFNGPNNYIYYDTVATELRIHAGGLKRMSISSTGGSLHGTWSSESIISASDERLKRRIEPLDRALAARAQPASISPGPPNRAEAVSWLLRELRPVSYYFREGPEAKLARYGFIAQELEKVMPELVRDHKEKKHVVYQDLVALLALSSQVQQERLEEYEARARKRAEKLRDQGSLLTKLSHAVANLARRITRWETVVRPLNVNKQMKRSK
ncbi:unnamed protein product [Effrenium voratum]|uniref:Peptidase S74 domain-containing protein n=1 Tax=Effrenium voratum TaxID=2562239 RepID=A0AA36MVV3_9DINO|nr:unnamed protein product [Effrenium voratum]